MGELTAQPFRDTENIVVDFRLAVDFRYWNTGKQPQNRNQPRKWDQWGLKGARTAL